MTDAEPRAFEEVTELDAGMPGVGDILQMNPDAVETSGGDTAAPAGITERTAEIGSTTQALLIALEQATQTAA